ncbi:FtsX-like permease family protein [Dyadobacter flavalbus]|uniref:FtsX-like permease family protein n=1 Tax=Dyadobacter flavalbus TaxID=2579942 RepID=A0A5M8Q731_9BACT|nr:ABC transporter permease [Dyadobacter flavalbus]KAA6430432.1 FtsX-like permease family protein [Dyadobacter flavalbus]
MLTNYLKIALRNLVKNKTYSLINIIGLALGMAVSVLMLIFVMHEFSYDKFHINNARIYRILAQIKMGDSDMQFTSFSAKLGPALKEYNPQVQDYVRVKPAYQKVVIRNPEKGGELFYEQHFLFADPSFFKVFSFELREGNPATMLEGPFTMVISERAARKYFGDEQAVGKMLVYEGKHMMQITGIAQDPPSNSTFDFDFVVSASTYPKLSGEDKKNWETAGIFTTYLLLDSEKSKSVVEKNIKREGNKTGAFDSTAGYKLESFGGIHLGNNFNESGNTKLIYIFAGIAVVILFLALFNYMSLITARATMRAKEVGVRKVVGAGKSGLVWQFYVESVLVCTFSFALAFLLVDLLQQPFYNLLDLHIDSSFLLSPEFIGFLALLLIVSALIAGSYPALILSGFRPLEVLKGKFAGSHNGASVRRAFMVFQFAVSITLIVCSLVVHNQLQFMQTKKLGLYKDQVLSVPLSATMAPNYFPLRNEIREQTGVQDVAFTNAGLFKGYNMFFLKNFTTGKDVSLTYMVVDKNFTRTLGLKWKTEPAEEIWKDRNYVVLNETAVRQLGMKGNPIGQKVGENDEVAGVLKDFHFSSVQNEIKAMGLFVVSDTSNVLKVPGAAGVLYVRLDPKANLKEKVAAIGGIFKKYDREKPFEYYFLDDAFNETFKTEIRMSRMFSVFTAFAIFIACMGLFGLVTFTAEVRTKEIGIRKVLGASVAGIVALLSRDFIRLVLVAIVLAIPSAYYLMNKWLQDFTYRIQIPVWIAIVSSISAIAIALLTVSFQSIKAALMNPVESLKSD